VPAVHAIQEFFEKHIKRSHADESAGKHDPLHVATAALFVEMMRMDGGASEVERDRVTKVLEAKFGVPSDKMTELLLLAEAQAQAATDYYRFTALIKDHFNAAERERLIENLWAVAYADGKLNRYEEHLVRKIADLLHVSHDSFIAAKLRARAAN
jgi:uncharacterized tellurite resistance protein B-like protein